jgi:hypothetical protein
VIRERNTPEKPLDEYEALAILCDRSHRHGAYLCLNYRRPDSGAGIVRLRDVYKGPRLVVQHLGGYADLEVRREDVTYVSARVVSVLLRWTHGRFHLGYTDEYERLVSGYGECHYADTGRLVGEGIEGLVRWIYGAPA